MASAIADRVRWKVSDQSRQVRLGHGVRGRVLPSVELLDRQTSANVVLDQRCNAGVTLLVTDPHEKCGGCVSRCVHHSMLART